MTLIHPNNDDSFAVVRTLRRLPVVFLAAMGSKFWEEEEGSSRQLPCRVEEEGEDEEDEKKKAEEEEKGENQEDEEDRPKQR